jgi:hypothetical protein
MQLCRKHTQVRLDPAFGFMANYQRSASLAAFGFIDRSHRQEGRANPERLADVLKSTLRSIEMV